jgi:hypothetical protein
MQGLPDICWLSDSHTFPDNAPLTVIPAQAGMTVRGDRALRGNGALTSDGALGAMTR